MVTLAEAKEHLRIEVDDDNTSITDAIERAENVVNQYIYPKTLQTLEDSEKPLAKQAVYYALYQFYYNRVPDNSKDFHECLVRTLQPIRTLHI